MRRLDSDELPAHFCRVRRRWSRVKFRGVAQPRSGRQKGFVENDWIGKTIAIGAGTLVKVTAPCLRCVMTTLAQGDLPKDPAILKTALRHNAAKVGVYATVTQIGTIRVADPVTII